MAVLLDRENRLFPHRQNKSVLANQPTVHSGGVASGVSATNVATPEIQNNGEMGTCFPLKLHPFPKLLHKIGFL